MYLKSRFSTVRIVVRLPIPFASPPALHKSLYTFHCSLAFTACYPQQLVLKGHYTWPTPILNCASVLNLTSTFLRCSLMLRKKLAIASVWGTGHSLYFSINCSIMFLASSISSQVRTLSFLMHLEGLCAFRRHKVVASLSCAKVRVSPLLDLCMSASALQQPLIVK